MNIQNANTILMVEPIAFGYNPETAENNYFQIKQTQQGVQEKALIEFNELVSKLQEKGIQVITVKDTLQPHTPDSIYPNNWVTFQHDGSIVLFPMNAKNRRLERRNDILQEIQQKYDVKEILDYSDFEEKEKFLEGTGSMVFDHENKIAYGCISNRLDKEVFEEYCKTFNFQAVSFHAYQSVGEKRLPIYHTNVMLSVAKEFVVICLASIDDDKERNFVIQQIVNSGKEIMDITEEQMHKFVGNMLQVQNQDGKSFMVMSKAAYDVLFYEQREYIEKFSEIIYSDLTTIEQNGGGSARCMMAEVFLEEKP